MQISMSLRPVLTREQAQGQPRHLKEQTKKEGVEVGMGKKSKSMSKVYDKPNIRNFK